MNGNEDKETVSGLMQTCMYDTNSYHDFSLPLEGIGV